MSNYHGGKADSDVTRLEQTGETRTALNISVPVEVKQALVAIASERRLQLRHVVMDALTEHIKRNPIPRTERD
jgi:hypothetical protein